MPEVVRQELPLLREMFARHGIRAWHSEGDEADDLAATLAHKVGQAGHRVTIISTDKGYCQLLSPQIQIRDYFQKRWLDMPFIAAEFGVTAQQLPDFWGLSGISSSKIPASPVSARKQRPHCSAPFLTWIHFTATLIRYRKNGVRN